MPCTRLHSVKGSSGGRRQLCEDNNVSMSRGSPLAREARAWLGADGMWEDFSISTQAACSGTETDTGVGRREIPLKRDHYVVLIILIWTL